MDETILFPSPNWFQVSVLTVSNDGWLVYGGPSKSLCIMEPLPKTYNGVIAGQQRYQAHVLQRAHPEKIVSVDLNPEWPEKRSVLTGSSDGSVKQWSLEKVKNILKIKSSHSHEIHSNEKEEIVGVGYSDKTFAVTLGSFGNMVKWDLNSNVVKNYNTILKTFKPLCMACSPHIPLHVAVGTKQGVIFLLDLNGAGKVVYKVRSQDDEIINIAWCPQYEVIVKKCLKEFEKGVKKSSLSERLEKIRNEPEPDVLDESGIDTKLPSDSFDETVVDEDDTFDIYKDHEADEFGHKKYQSEEILVKVKDDDNEATDYLAECMKLKEEILKRKNQAEPTIESLVEALDKTHVDEGNQITAVKNEAGTSQDTESTRDGLEASNHIHRHLLATVGKFGGVRIWSKSGKLVCSCVVSNNTGKNQKGKMTNWPTLLWYKPNTLLIADGKSQLLECNPLKTDWKNKLEWHVVHSFHKRGMYCIASNAPRVQTSETVDASDDWSVWTTSQDRNLIQYSMEKQQKLAIHASCGGFVYSVEACPYDAGKLAVSVGDGAVRVWESSTVDDDDTKLIAGHTSSYWQNVQGKVLTIAWHPTRENLLAFGTAESRVGLIDTSGKGEKPAKVLLPALAGGVYGLCWGELNDLYACAAGDLVVYHTNKLDEAPEQIKVEFENHKWDPSMVRWYHRGLLCGSNAGGVAVLTPQRPHVVVAAAFIFSKMIHTVVWHPQQTSSSNEESPYKNLIAACSLDKQNSIVIMDYKDKEGGGKELAIYKTLVGHKHTVFQVVWNPHRDAQLLSTSQDATVRVWDAAEGVCTAIFGGHGQSTIGATWCAYPQLSTKIISGGTDCCLRLWDYNDHKPEDYEEVKQTALTKKEKKKKEKKEVKKREEESASDADEHIAASLDAKVKAPKKYLMPNMYRQINQYKLHGARVMLQRYLEKTSTEFQLKDGELENSAGSEFDYLKIFGSINDVNEVLDLELQRHMESGTYDAWILLSIFRGHIDATIQFAAQKDMLCPFLVSIAPCVSLKYWKDTTQLYISQIDRLVAKGEGSKLCENKFYGGPIFRKVAMLLSVHDVKEAVKELVDAKLYKEAYILCRIRYMDSIAQEILYQWARHCIQAGTLATCAIIYIHLGELSEAATALGKSNDEQYLSLAAEIAKVIGQNTFADHVEKKAQAMASEKQELDKTEQLLEELPSRIELLMKNTVENGESVNGHNGNGKVSKQTEELE